MLTEASAKAATPKAKPYKLFDFGGLYLLVTVGGARQWRLKYFFNRKENLMSLGVYPETSLAVARQRRDAARASLEAGVDPVAYRRAERARARVTLLAGHVRFELNHLDELVVTAPTQSFRLSAARTYALRLLLSVQPKSQGDDDGVD
jgi:hypothetical protein